MLTGQFFTLGCEGRSLIEGALRTCIVLSAMITSISGHDLRTPVDIYAFKCEAKQCSLEVVVMAPRCLACTFIGKETWISSFCGTICLPSPAKYWFYFWLQLIHCWPCLDCVSADSIPTCRLNPWKNIFPPTSFLYFLCFFSFFVFSKSLILSQPSRTWNTYCFSLSAGSHKELWLCFIKLVFILENQCYRQQPYFMLVRYICCKYFHRHAVLKNLELCFLKQKHYLLVNV